MNNVPLFRGTEWPPRLGHIRNRNQVVPALSPSRYPYPLGLGFTPSRFSPNSDVRNLPFWAGTGALSSSKLPLLGKGSAYRCWSAGPVWHDLFRFIAPDGILYPSRLNEEINLALYDVALAKARLSLAFDQPHLVGRTSLWSSIGPCVFRSFG